jgi:hypothetical protein
MLVPPLGTMGSDQKQYVIVQANDGSSPIKAEIGDMVI